MKRRSQLLFLSISLLACAEAPRQPPGPAWIAAPVPPPAFSPASAPSAPHAVAAHPAPEIRPEALVRAEALLPRMTLEQKVGQLLVVGISGTSVDRHAEELIRGRQVGGVCLFKRNIVSADQVAQLNDDMRRLLSDFIPPFIAVDQEGGNVVRIHDGAVVLPGNMALGATGSASLAYEAGFAQAEDLKLLGFNMNLAPVLDVNLNPRNPVIGIRSFGDDAERVAEFGLEFVRGQQDANIATVAKHFPGHGSTDADSHKALPVMRETEAEVMAQLKPFTAVIGEGLDGLMTAHVAVPSMTRDDTPATLSHAVLTELLRRRLGFDGLVLTDELEMEAIASRYGVGRAAVLAVNAGADMVLIPWRPVAKTEVHRALWAAARSGEISRRRLDEAVLRILTLKFRRGIFDEPPPLAERLRQLRGTERPDVAARIARASVTLLRADPAEFPIRPEKRVGVITAEAALARALEAKLPDVVSLVVPAYPANSRRAELREKARELALDVDVVVVGVINARQLELVTMAAAANRPVLVVSMGLPYLVEFVPEAKAVLALYSYRGVSAEAAADALVGGQGTPGHLPVSLRRYRRGFGLDLFEQKVSGESAAVHGPR